MTMEITGLEIRDNERDSHPLFNGELLFRDALATYARMRWPTNTVKQCAREWGLTLDEGRGVVSARASQSTIDKILRSPTGGWAVALPILGAVIGQGLDDFITSERRKHAQQALKERALLRDLRALAPDCRRLPAELVAARVELARPTARRMGQG